MSCDVVARLLVSARTSAAVVLLTLLAASSGVSRADPTRTHATVIADLDVGTDYQGPVRRIAFEESGDTWMATMAALYQIRGGKAEELDRGLPGQRLALAPSGHLYAWLDYREAPMGLFTVELLEIPKKPIATLKLPDFPFGFGTLYLGGAGQLIVTATPLDNAESLEGQFLYVFWSPNGRPISRVKLDGPRIGVLDPAGDALLLLGASDAVAFGNDGRELWRLQGRFRKGALARSGNVALLNPADLKSINDVLVVRNDQVTSPTQVTSLTMSDPVYDLALTNDGSEGAIGIRTGDVHLVTPTSCNANACPPLRVSPGPGGTTPYRITTLRFVDRNTLAIGRIQEIGAAPPFAYPEGALAFLSISESSLSQQTVVTLPLKQPATWSPSVDTRYDLKIFAAHTPHRVVVVKLDQQGSP